VFCESWTVFDTVRHTTHIGAAISILKNGSIAAEPAADSHLKDIEGRFAWTSPNYWFLGSIYGHVSFVFPWATLLEYLRPVHSYYVGYVAKYNAYQILLTERSDIMTLKPYSATDRRGPWWYDQLSDQHCRHGDRTLHFIIARDLPLALATEIDITDHNENCVKFREECADKGFSCQRAMAVFMARAVAHNAIDQVQHPMAAVASSTGEWCHCWEQIENMAHQRVQHFSGELTAGHGGSEAAAKALLEAIGENLPETIRQVGKQFQSADEMIQSLKDVVFPAFGLSEHEWTLFKQSDV
jgi:hypothetical protein